MTTLTLSLPWPPSVNHYWRHVTKGKLAGRSLISAAGRAYQRAVALCCAADPVAATATPALPLWSTAEVQVTMVAHPPDRRRRDVDNLIKAPLDALKKVGVFEDDHLVADLRIVRGEVVRGGRLEVTIQTLL